jgi:7-cyano-7-deazaguanine synthase in queuosine biosynthesis
MIQVATRFYPHGRKFAPSGSAVSDFQQIAYYLHSAALRRSSSIEIPVSNHMWNDFQTPIQDVFRFLVGWSLRVRFAKGKAFVSQEQLTKPEKFSKVALFSGGLDSGAYSALLARTGENAILSHTSTSKMLLGKAKRFYKKNARGHNALAVSHAKLPLHESTINTRGLVFLTNALTMAAHMGVHVVEFPENGPMMINPSVSTRALFTRTANPWMIFEWSRIFEEATRSRVDVKAPFANRTKAEVVILLNDPDAVANTYSCFTSRGQSAMCGLCISCIVRRLSCLAAGVTEDIKVYEHDWLIEDYKRLQRMSRWKLNVASDAVEFWKGLADPSSIRIHEQRREAERLVGNYEVLQRHAIDMFIGIKKAVEINKRSLGTAGANALRLLQNIDKTIIIGREEELAKLQQPKLDSDITLTPSASDS